MKKNIPKIILQSLIISIIGVFVIDYFSHLLFSNPMETAAYFLAKATLYFVYSAVVLSIFKFEKSRFPKIVIAGIIVASLWGIYYNILPLLFDFYPFGIPLEGLTFLGMGIIGTGIAFGAVHTLAFVGGYYASDWVMGKFK